MSSEQPRNDSASASGIDLTDSSAPLARCYLRTSHVVAVMLLALVFLFFSLVPPLFHTDFWGHLKYGEWIVHNRSLPATEPFSAFADQEQPFVDFQWLSQVGYYCVFRGGAWLAGGDETRKLAGSVDVTRAGHAILLTLRCGLLLLAYWRLCGSLSIACAALGVGLGFGFTHHMIQRPQLVGEVCFAGLLAVLSDSNSTWRRSISVGLLFAIWANAHGSFVVGLGFLGLVGLGKCIEAARRASGWRDVWHDRSTRFLAAYLAIGVAAAAFVNPYGPALFGRVIALSGHPNVRQMAEWQPITSAPDGLLIGLYVGLTLLVIVFGIASRQLPTPTWLLAALVFGMAPWWQQRHYIWWVMIAPWLLVPPWRAIAERWRGRAELMPSQPSLRNVMLTAGTVVLAIVWSSPFQLLVGQDPLPLSMTLSRATPYFVMDKLPEPFRAREQFPGRIWTSETLADYWLWTLPDSQALFVYSHVHVFPEKHWAEHTSVLFGGSEWRRVVDRHQVNLMIVEPELRPALAEQLRRDDGWRILLDEAGSADKRDPRMRLLVAVRKQLL